MNSGGCPVCRAFRIKDFLFRETVPAHQNLLIPDRQSAADVRRGSLALAVCLRCGFVFNQAFDKKLLSYGREYDNDQARSPLFKEYLDRQVEYLVGEKKLRGKRIIEIGCGNGWMLKEICRRGDNTGIGFDPSYRGPGRLLGGRLRFVRKMFQEAGDLPPADAVICRHVIEHEPNPLELLGSIGRVIEEGRPCRLFFETPSVEWIFRKGAFWDFFFEHCSYFCSASLKEAFCRSGFRVEKITPAFGGQYIRLEASPAITGDPAPAPGRIPGLAEAFGRRERELIERWKARLSQFRASGPVAVWGAGAKGVTFVNLIDPDRRLIECVVDLNPNKRGGVIPVTGHSIVSFRDLAGYDIATAIIMNSNYTEECRGLLRGVGADIRLVELEPARKGFRAVNPNPDI